MVHALKVEIVKGRLQRSNALDVMLLSGMSLPEGFGGRPSFSPPRVEGRLTSTAEAWFLSIPGTGSIGFLT